MVRLGFELSIFGSIRVRSLRIGFELGGLFRVWVISGHATILVSFDSGSVYFECLDPNRFIPFRVSIRISGLRSVLPGLTLR